MACPDPWEMREDRLLGDYEQYVLRVNQPDERVEVRPQLPPVASATSLRAPQTPEPIPSYGV